MLFTGDEIQQILERVSFEILMFGAQNIGVDVLSEDERQVLRDHGIDIDELSEGFTPLEQSFLFGRLTQLIGEDNTNKIDYSDFNQYIFGSQFIPLSDFEKETLYIAKKRSYSHLTTLEQGVRKDIEGIILEDAAKRRSSYEDIVSGKISQTYFQRESIKKIVSDIGNKTGDWQRDLGRIADTEMNNLFQEGIAVGIIKEHGADANVYKDVYPGACRHCIRLYLKRGVGSEPIVFKLRDLIANGTNIGLKVADWKATVGSTHPWCRCLLRFLREGLKWSREKKRFVEPEYVSKRKGLEGLISVQVGKYQFKV